MVPIIRTAIESDFDGILALHARNLYTNLSPSELAGGFVSNPFTSALLGQLLGQDGVFIAESESKIVGYILAGDWNFYAQWEIFILMISRLPELKFQGRELSVDRTFQ